MHWRSLFSIATCASGYMWEHAGAFSRNSRSIHMRNGSISSIPLYSYHEGMLGLGHELIKRDSLLGGGCDSCAAAAVQLALPALVLEPQKSHRSRSRHDFELADGYRVRVGNG